MIYRFQQSPVAVRTGLISACGRRAPILAIVTLACSIGLSGCNRAPAGLVPVSGKLTLDGHAWAKSGQINFSPAKPTPGHPVMPNMARLNEDGTFAILNSVAPGLMPGEYIATIRCWEKAPDDRHAGKSAVAERYGSPQTSGLKVTVPEGSGPIVVNWDIKSK
jgi:hypothetical protein